MSEEMLKRPCPDCPDGYVWNDDSPTSAACPTCGGLAYILKMDDLTYLIRRDGNAWFATRSDFKNLMESISGFGPSPLHAFVDLYIAEAHEETLRRLGGGGGGTRPLPGRAGGGGGKNVTAVGRCVPCWGMK